MKAVKDAENSTARAAAEAERAAGNLLPAGNKTSVPGYCNPAQIHAAAQRRAGCAVASHHNDPSL